jgi:ribosome-associated protein
MVADTRCHSVVVLDVAGISPVTDFFVLATGTSHRQMRSAADAAEELAQTTSSRPLSRVGDESGSWIVVDLFDVVVHIFNPDSRMYYDLDGLWGDAPRVHWERPEKKTKPPA